MTLSRDEIEKRALELPLNQRLELAQRLWDSVEPPSSFMEDKGAVQEALRRNAEIEAGLVKGVSHEEVMQNARRAIGLD
ncbi:MAG: addiction module protein [Pirellulales bacterium]|nr:addiction module protein [Pirellulales bacterium]